MARSTRKRLLAIDDEEDILIGYRRGFGHTHEVTTATSLEEGLVLARDIAPDLAVVDLLLDGEDSGLDAIEKLRSIRPWMTIVLVSGYLSTNTTVAAVKAGANFVINKPTTARAILKTIDESKRKVTPTRDDVPSLARAEWEHISQTLADNRHNITHTARRLQIPRFTLQRKLRKGPPKPKTPKSS